MDLGRSISRFKDLYLSNTGSIVAGYRINMNNTNGGIFFGTTGANGAGGFGDNGAIARAGSAGYHTGGSQIGDMVIAAERQKDLLFSTISNSSGGVATRMKIDQHGRVTKPAQPAFMIGKNSESNIPINTTHVIGYNLERYDQGNNFASNTFTAPVTGKYYLRASVRADAVDVSANYYSLTIVTSNREYAIINAPRYNSDPSYITFAVSATCDMDVGDTAYVQIIQSGGASQTDLDSSSNASYFCGYLLG